MKARPKMRDGLPAEELARARVYGLLARLFSAPPDAALLDAMASADDVDADDRTLVDAWLDLCCAAANTDEETASAEYRRAFGGRRRARAERLAAVCHALRYAIANHPYCLASQQRFFEQEAAAAERLCASIEGALYRQIGRFASAFVRIEREAFALPRTDDQPWRLNA